MNIDFELSPEETELLTRAATRLGIGPRELARTALAEFLDREKEAFGSAAEYVLAKNAELYRRLA